MTITILVSAFERYEQPTEVAVFELQSVDLSKGLSCEQMTKLLEIIQPELEKKDLTFYRYLKLEYYLGGIPKLAQTWTTGQIYGRIAEAWVPLDEGLRRLSLEFSVVPDIPVFSL